MRNGQFLKCFLCNSETHLVAQCPLRQQQGGAQHHATAARPPVQQQQNRNTQGHPRGPPQPQFDPSGSAFIDPMDGPPYTSSMRAYHLNAVEVEQRQLNQERRQDQLHLSIEDKRSSPSSRTTTRKVTFAPEVRHASTETSAQIELGELWLQAMEDGAQTVKSQKVKKVFAFTSRFHPTQQCPIAEHYEIYETRMDNGDEGILIDTGASINCVGRPFCERFDRLMEERGAPPSERVSYEELPGVQSISGLGEGSENTSIAAKIPCHAHGLGGGRTFFKGAYLAKQSSPAIMGMCSLRALNCIIDCRKGRETMYISPEGDDFDISSRGNMGRALPLVRARSGHIMLPISGYQRQDAYPVEAEDNYRGMIEESIAAEDRPTKWEVLSAQSLR